MGLTVFELLALVEQGMQLTQEELELVRNYLITQTNQSNQGE
jgi:hypothetical protein